MDTLISVTIIQPLLSYHHTGVILLGKNTQGVLQTSHNSFTSDENLIKGEKKESIKPLPNQINLTAIYSGNSTGLVPRVKSIINNKI